MSTYITEIKTYSLICENCLQRESVYAVCVKDSIYSVSMFSSHLVLAEVAASLNETLGLDFQLSNSTSQSLQEDISAMLETMRRRHFLQEDQNVTTVLK